MGLAWAIRKARADTDLSQRDLAQLVGLDPSQMSRLEQGKANPTWGTVRRISAALEMELAALAAIAEDFEKRLQSEDPNGSR